MRPKAAEALAALTAMPGRLVGRDELRRRIWGDTQVEWETGLHQVIRQLRRALEDEASSPSFIQTVPRQGYRFIAPIEGEPPGHASAAIRRPLSAIALVALGAFGFPAAVILLCILFAS